MRREKYGIREKMFKIYDVGKEEKGIFLLQIDWLLENAVFPFENGYADNLIELWNVYMPNYKFNKIILEYSKKYFSVLRYVHEKNVDSFNSVKNMQETAIKNFVKFRISQGEVNRFKLMNECLSVFKNIVDEKETYEIFVHVIENYFLSGEIEQFGEIFLKRFQDYMEQPYEIIIGRLADLYNQKERAMNARLNLYNSLNTSKEEEKFQTLINILLCRLAISDGEQRFSDVLRIEWNRIFSDIPYDEKIYEFIKEYEKPYMTAACYSIKNIGDVGVIRKLYKDAVILCAVIKALEKGKKYGLREVNDFWKQDGMRFANGYFFDDEYERMKRGFNTEILLKNKEDIKNFHSILLKKIDTVIDDKVVSEKRSSLSEMNRAVINEKDKEIEELQEKIIELEDKVSNTEKEVLSRFISLLDSKKYDYVLGKLYRMAYTGYEFQVEEIQRVLKNFFEIMNISGIDIYGDINEEVKEKEIKSGKYRVDKEISGKAIVKYPGYRVENTVILHPLAEEV